MRYLRWLLLLLIIGFPPKSFAQNITGFVVSVCGTVPAPFGPYSAGKSGSYTVDVNGNLCSSGTGGGGGLSVTDAAAWTTAVSQFTPTGGVFNDSATALTSGQQGTVRLTASRSIHNTPFDSGGGDMTDVTNHVLFIDTRATGNLQTSLGTGTAVNGATYPASSIGVGQKDASGNIQPVIANPCQTVVQTSTPINITTATTTRIVAPTSAKKTYVCAISFQATAADNVGVVEGTGGTCGASTAGVYGGTTAASGLNLAANQGFAWGNGSSAVMQTASANFDLCLITSANTNLSGHVRWVQF